MLSSTLGQPTQIDYTASRYVPMLVNPRAKNTRSMPLFGARGELKQGGAALALGAIAIGSVLSGLTTAGTFYVYKRTESPVWTGAAVGLGSLALGILGVGIGALAARKDYTGTA
jgi:hypothetical protein